MTAFVIETFAPSLDPGVLEALSQAMVLSSSRYGYTAQQWYEREVHTIVCPTASILQRGDYYLTTTPIEPPILMDSDEAGQFRTLRNSCRYRHLPC